MTSLIFAGITCYDKMSGCGVLRDNFAMCLNQVVVKKLGCELTCGRCSEYIMCSWFYIFYKEGKINSSNTQI